MKGHHYFKNMSARDAREIATECANYFEKKHDEMIKKCDRDEDRKTILFLKKCYYISDAISCALYDNIHESETRG